MKRPKMMDLKVRDYMSTDLVTAAPDEPLSKIIGQMKARDVHEIPIVQKNELLGLVTLAEIPEAGLAANNQGGTSRIAGAPDIAR